MATFFMDFVKIVLAVLLLPAVYACALNFSAHVSSYPPVSSDFFGWGIFSFVLVFIFLHRFRKFYEIGHNIMAGVWKFAAPLNHFFARLFPFYAVLILLAFFVVHTLLKINSQDHYFLFFAGFLYCMHIILTATELQEEENRLVKSTYFLQMCFVAIASSVIVILLFDLSYKTFAFPVYMNTVLEQSKDIYLKAYNFIVQ